MMSDLLCHFVDPEVVERLDLDHMERVNAKFHAEGNERREGDVIWRIPMRDGTEVSLYLLAEFQSTVDPWMAGTLFVLPSLFILSGLTWVYLVFGEVTLVKGVFNGIKPAVVAIVGQEAYVQGGSPRRVDELVQAVGMTGISKSQVLRLCAEIDERVHSFLDRPLTGEWPILWLDATWLKVRRAGRILPVETRLAEALNSLARNPEIVQSTPRL